MEQEGVTPINSSSSVFLAKTSIFCVLGYIISEHVLVSKSILVTVGPTIVIAFDLKLPICHFQETSYPLLETCFFLKSNNLRETGNKSNYYKK